MGGVRRSILPCHKGRVFPSSSGLCNSSKISLSSLISGLKLPKQALSGLDSLFAPNCLSESATEVKEKPSVGKQAKARNPDPEKAVEKPPAGKEEKEAAVVDGKKEDGDANVMVVQFQVHMHCEGCARKVKKTISRIPGVKDVEVDRMSQKVMVKVKSAEVHKVVEHLHKSISDRKPRLITPLPEPPKEEPPVPVQEAKPEPVKTAVVVLKVHMHCGKCAGDIKKAVLQFPGVEAAEADRDSEQVRVRVRETVPPAKLVHYLHRKTGKQAQVLLLSQSQPQPSTQKEKQAAAAEEPEPNKKPDQSQGQYQYQYQSKSKADDAEQAPVSALLQNQQQVQDKSPSSSSNYGHGYEYQVAGLPRYDESVYMYGHAPQLFSDDNPNSCSLM